MTITEITSMQRHWGRFYLPAPIASSLDADGRILTAKVDQILTAAHTLYTNSLYDSYVPVVWSIQKPDRPKANGGTLPAAPAVAYQVGSLQMDNLFDVIRSRRWEFPTYKPRQVVG